MLSETMIPTIVLTIVNFQFHMQATYNNFLEQLYAHISVLPLREGGGIPWGIRQF